MKKLLLAAALAAVSAPALSGAPAPATVRPDADPALWVLRDEDTTIYLFGTFHLLDGRRDWFNDEVRTAFDRSDELVLEIVLPDDPAALQPVIQRYAVDASGRTLSQRLPAPLRERLTATLGRIGLPAAAVERYEPWFVSMLLVTTGAQRVGITGEHGPETVLTAAARARGMPVRGVETAESQIAMLDATPQAVQIEQLDMTLQSMSSLEGAFGPMTEAWAAGDSGRLYAIMNGQMAQSPELYRTVFVERNARWTDWLRERMERPGTVFLAVGAGHLAGPDSVQAMLARRGLRTERVAQ
ncbi:MAG TPA: TraB/GumN family protein [Allosphingosinicella sp.]|jgi:uncharacterized protein YbaP (TraB family)|nr:TraB/GumN family protein [Allosphingosinicella sp.]